MTNSVDNSIHDFFTKAVSEIITKVLQLIAVVIIGLIPGGGPLAVGLDMAFTAMDGTAIPWITFLQLLVSWGRLLH